jgi:UDP-N-acetyl-D-glucosamine dehydrogenase
LNDKEKSVKGSNILVLGLSYKPNVDDERESPSYVLMEMLKAQGAKLAYYDPYVPIVRPKREHPTWVGTKSIEWNRKAIGAYDLVLISTNHACVNYQELAEWAPLIVDTRNAMHGCKTREGQVWKA